MIRALSILAAIAALAVTAAPVASAHESQKMQEMNMSLNEKAGPPKPCGIVVTKHQDCASTNLRRKSSSRRPLFGPSSGSVGFLFRDNGNDVAYFGSATDTDPIVA